MESSFGKKLASTEQNVRDKAIRTLKKWLKLQGSSLCYKEYLRLWKGLFYSYWMADKPKYQFELAERLSGIAKVLSHAFPEEEEEEASEELPFPASLMYIRAFWETLCREWNALDRLRLNKFYNLAQQFMKVGFEILQENEFESEITSAYFHILREFPMNMSNDKVPSAIRIYFVENYISVLKTLEEAYDANMSLILLSPLMEALADAKGKTLLKALEETFMSLRTVTIGESAVKEEEDQGEDNETSSASASEDEEEETMFDLSFVGPSLFQIGADPEVASPNRKILYGLSESLKDLANLEGFEEESGGCCGGHGHDHDHDSMEEQSEGSESGSEEDSGSDAQTDEEEQ